MAITLYYAPGSAASRAAMLTVKALKLDVNVVLVDLFKREQMNPEFIKINPQHTVPTLVDDGFAIWESRAIMTYLANKYGRDTNLYSEDPKARAVVDQRLYFDMGSLYHKFSEYFYPIVMSGAPSDKKKLAELEETLQFLDTFLEGQKYAAGPNLTLADLSLVASMSCFEITDIDFKKYANIKRWYETVITTAPGYKEVTEEGLNSMKDLLSKMKK